MTLPNEIIIDLTKWHFWTHCHKMLVSKSSQIWAKGILKQSNKQIVRVANFSKRTVVKSSQILQKVSFERKCEDWKITQNYCLINLGLPFDTIQCQHCQSRMISNSNMLILWYTLVPSSVSIAFEGYVMISPFVTNKYLLWCRLLRRPW